MVPTRDLNAPKTRGERKVRFTSIILLSKVQSIQIFILNSKEAGSW